MERHFPRLKSGSDEAFNESENVSNKSSKSKHRFQGLMQLISRPNRQQLQMNTSDMSEDESVVSSKEIKLSSEDIHSKRIAIYFIVDALLESMRVEDPEGLKKVMKQKYIEKWHEMITHGLDDDICYKVFDLESKGPKLKPQFIDKLKDKESPEYEKFKN